MAHQKTQGTRSAQGFPQGGQRASGGRIGTHQGDAQTLPLPLGEQRLQGVRPLMLGGGIGIQLGKVPQQAMATLTPARHRSRRQGPPPAHLRPGKPPPAAGESAEPKPRAAAVQPLEHHLHEHASGGDHQNAASPAGQALSGGGASGFRERREGGRWTVLGGHSGRRGMAGTDLPSLEANGPGHQGQEKDCCQSPVLRDTDGRLAGSPPPPKHQG